MMLARPSLTGLNRLVRYNLLTIFSYEVGCFNMLYLLVDVVGVAGVAGAADGLGGEDGIRGVDDVRIVSIINNARFA